VLVKQEKVIPEAPFIPERIKIVFSWLRPVNTLLDVGCGRGNFTAVLARRAVNTYGVDVSAVEVGEARLKYPGIFFAQATAENLPFEDKIFDAISFLEVLEHVEDESQAISEIKRVLKDGGQVLISVPHKGLFAFLDPDNLIFNPVFSLRNLLKSQRHKNRALKFHRHYSLNDIRDLLGSDFEIVELHRGGLFVHPISFAICKILQVFINHSPLALIPVLRRIVAILRGASDWDLRRDWGRWGYNLILKAQKRGA